MMADMFSELLKDHRSRSGLSYDELGARSCVDGAYIYCLEKGKKNNPDRDVIIRLGVGLGLDVLAIDELVTSTSHPPLIRRKRQPNQNSFTTHDV